ncbi:MAG: hypothetical protein ACXVIR_09940 [Halobacteriota archaeon]
MNTSEFYYCTSLLLTRLGYLIDIEQMDSKARDEQEHKSRKWVDLAFSAIEIYTGQELPWYQNFHVKLGDLSPEQQKNFRADWHHMTEDIPIAGLRYARGLPLMFGVKVVDFEDPDKILERYERMHKEFLKFGEDYVTVLDRYGASNCTICFAFTDPQSFEKAKAALGSGRGKSSWWHRGSTSAWLFNLDSFELITSGSLSEAPLKLMESLASTVTSTVSGNKDPQNLNEWDPPNQFLTSGLIGPHAFLDFTRLFSKLLEQGEITVPTELLNSLREEEITHEKRGLEAQLEDIDNKIEASYFTLGEILFQKFQTEEIFPEAGESLRNATQASKTIEHHQGKLSALEGHRKEWSDSRERSNQLKSESAALEKDFRDSCAQFGESLFEKEQELIKQDERLEKIFTESLGIQKEVSKRLLLISNLEKGQGGVFGRVKANAQIVYLKGLNQKDHWSIGKKCRSAGMQAFETLPDLPATCLVYPLWMKLGDIQEKNRTCNEAIQKELRLESTVEDQVRDLSAIDQIGSYPWGDVERHYKEDIAQLTNRYSESIITAGREFRLANRTVGDELLEVEKDLSQLDENKGEILRQLQVLK